jgi:isopropylmalate/homocitrate/citramalate synthase
MTGIAAGVVFEDTTLRDGEQTPGIAFGVADKIRIHDLLVGAGVRWIEAGIPAMGGDELRALRQLIAKESPAMLIAWNRGVRADVEQSLGLGFEAIHIGLPASDRLLRASVGRDRTWLLEQARVLIAVAKEKGAFVSISAEDVARTELGFLQEYACVVAEAGADRLRLSDTIGALGPEAYARRVEAVKAVSDIAIQCHAHNDYGLALANTLAGVKAGARWFHATVNGIGERAGMLDLAQAVMVLQRLYGIDLGIDPARLKPLSDLVSSLTGVAPPPWQPVVGENVFAHESGIHVNAMLRDSEAFEAFAPAEVGGTRRLVLGKHSGRALVRQMLSEAALEADEDEIAKCLELSRAWAVKSGESVDTTRLTEILETVRSG